MLIKEAKIKDLDQIINLLNNDFLKKDIENYSKIHKQKYISVFYEISQSKYFSIFVMENNNEILGFYQIMFLPHISFKGSKRGQIENLIIRSKSRRNGLGTN